MPVVESSSVLYLTPWTISTFSLYQMTFGNGFPSTTTSTNVDCPVDDVYEFI